MKLGFIKRSLSVVWALFVVRVSKKRVPVKVGIQITKHCNLRCAHCYSDKTTNVAGEKEPSFEEIKELIDKCYNYGCRWAYFLGGEPTIRKDIGAIIRYAKSKGLLTEMNTNGHFLIKKYDDIKDIDLLAISLDGDREANDVLRGAGSFDKTMDAIMFARERRMNFRVHSVLTKQSKDSLEFMQGLYDQYGIMYNFSGFESDNPEMHDRFECSLEDRQKFYSQYLEMARRKKGIYNSIKSIQYVVDWPFEEASATKEDLARHPDWKYLRCQHAQTFCAIDTNGDMNPCIGMWHFGKNIYKDGFDEAWKYLADTPCLTCRFLGSVETSMYLLLDPVVLWGGFKNLFVLSRD